MVILEDAAADPIDQIVNDANFSEDDIDTATAQYCGTFAIALYDVLKERGINGQFVLIGLANPDGTFKIDKRTGEPWWRHVAVEHGGYYYDIHGKNELQWLYDNYVWGYTEGGPGMMPVTFEQLMHVLKLTGGSYSQRYRNEWEKKLRGDDQ